MAHPITGRCPICGDMLYVSTLHCPACDATITGHFDLGAFGRLSPEQLAFAALFIRCEGKITRVQQELGISYPTVRNRLQDLIQALDYPIGEAASRTAEERRQVLDRLSTGELTADEAIELLTNR